MQAPLKLPPLMLHHRNLRLEWARKYMTLNLSCVLFIDEIRADLTVGQMVGYISEMSITSVYNINNRVEQ